MNCASITPDLWVGPWPEDSEDYEYLKAQGITAILSLQSEEDLEQRDAQSPENTARSFGLAFRNVAVTDFDALDLYYQLPKCVGALEDFFSAGHKVYVHCTAGVSRSPTVAAAYLHWCLDWPLEKALDHVKEARNCCPMGAVIRRAQWQPRN